MALGWRSQYYRYKDLFLNISALYKQRKDLRVFLELILSITTTIIFILFALKPTVLTIINLYNEIKAKEATLTVLRQKITNLQTANRIYSQNQADILSVNNVIFGGPKPDFVGKQILGLTNNASVSFLGISVGTVNILGQPLNIKNSTDLKPLPNGALSIPISINVKGNYANIISFIKSLENLKIPIKIDSVTLTSSQLEGGNAIVSIITARVPYLGQ